MPVSMFAEIGTFLCQNGHVKTKNSLIKYNQRDGCSVKYLKQ